MRLLTFSPSFDNCETDLRERLLSRDTPPAPRTDRQRACQPLVGSSLALVSQSVKVLNYPSRPCNRGICRKYAPKKAQHCLIDDK
ncbi:hypothetical protein RRG08_017472 [Elysia crispata]|uniref:Uncharacterized protein n=1 Tax=Elysia crispata TaxID=231223 RepID=A0AAE0YIU2_9GAST|nr:hypothetical protein RRG08_017472 [Elysia crispata]